MRISAKGQLFGYPALKVRDLLRAAHWGMTASLAAAMLEIDEAAALAFIAAMEADGFLEASVKSMDDVQRWQLSVKGAALSMASAAPPMKRAAAEELLVAFLRRVELVRDDARFVRKVESVVLFGSIMTDAASLGDIDVAIRFRPMHADKEKQDAAEAACRDAAETGGRTFVDFFARLTWPETDVRRFLKDRRPISMHDPRDDGPIIEAGPHATVYAGEAVIEGAIPLLRGWNTQEARDARELADKKRTIGALKRLEVAQRKALKEQDEMKAALDRVMAMSPEERAQRQDEIDQLLVDVQRRLNSRRWRVSGKED